MEKDIKYFKAGEKLTAQALNEMLDDIAENQEGIEEVSEKLSLSNDNVNLAMTQANEAYLLANDASMSASQAKQAAEEAKKIAEEAKTNVEIDINIENGSGKDAIQQLQDQDKDKTIEGPPLIPLGYFSFKGRNKRAAELAVNYPEFGYEYLYDWHVTDGTEEKDYVPYGAKGDYSISLGGKSLAKGKRSIAMGTTTLALANYSHAEGDVTVAMGNDSHVEGYETTTAPFATAAHAEGSQTVAMAEAAHAEGIWTVAANQGAHAGGIGTWATGVGQYSIGRYNEIESDSMLFVVGAGKDDEDRKTVFKIDSNGGIYYLKKRSDERVDSLPLQDRLTIIDHNYQRQTELTQTLSSAHNWMMKYIFNIGGERISQITKNKYPSGTKISFKYFIPAGTETKWWGLAWTKNNSNPSIYDAAVPNTAHCLSTMTGEWTDVEFTLPEGGPYYLYFGSEVGNWKLNGDNAYALIKDFAIDDEITDFSCNTDEWIFYVKDNNAVKAAAQKDVVTVNVEKGTGVGSTQQTPREDKVTIADGEEVGHFSFTGHPEAGMSGRVQYGAVGNYSAVLNGRGAALNKHATAVGNSTIAKGEESFAQGYETVAEGGSSFAGGSRCYAKGEGSHTEGIDNLAGTDAAHTEGANTKVISYSIIETGNAGGDSSTTTPDDVPSYGDYDTIEEFGLKAAACGHSEGNNTTVMGYGAHAECVGTNAYGHASHAEGWCTQAGEFVEEVGEDGKTYRIANRENGFAAHAEGYNTKALGNYSHASGFNTVASRPAQTVVGQYNKLDNRDGSVFVVGGGEAEAARKNALEVIRDGEIIILWEGAYYSLNLMLNLIANAHGGTTFFDEAKKQ